MLATQLSLTRNGKCLKARRANPMGFDAPIQNENPCADRSLRGGGSRDDPWRAHRRDRALSSPHRRKRSPSSCPVKQFRVCLRSERSRLCCLSLRSRSSSRPTTPQPCAHRVGGYPYVPAVHLLGSLAILFFRAFLVVLSNVAAPRCSGRFLAMDTPRNYRAKLPPESGACFVIFEVAGIGQAILGAQLLRNGETRR